MDFCMLRKLASGRAGGGICKFWAYARPNLRQQGKQSVFEFYRKEANGGGCQFE